MSYRKPSVLDILVEDSMTNGDISSLPVQWQICKYYAVFSACSAYSRLFFDISKKNSAPHKKSNRKKNQANFPEKYSEFGPKSFIFAYKTQNFAQKTQKFPKKTLFKVPAKLSAPELQEYT